MKLKKIASLMLAGVMAVSMLAGCSNGSNNNDSSNEPTVATGIVAAMNAGQSATNKVKVTFTSNSSVKDALTKTLKSWGDFSEIAQPDHLSNAIQQMTGLTAQPSMEDITSVDVTNDGALVDSNVDGKVITRVGAFVVKNVMSEEAAEKTAVSQIDALISRLTETTYKKGVTKTGDKYADYTYTGTIDLVSAQTAQGVTNYFVAYTITRTTSVKTVEKAA